MVEWQNIQITKPALSTELDSKLQYPSKTQDIASNNIFSCDAQCPRDLKFIDGQVSSVYIV